MESVKDDVRHLCGKLEDEEYANILLFLTHLTDSPFILEEIAGVIESSQPDIDTAAVEEGITEIDKLIDTIARLADKDRKLRELRAEYAAVRERIWVPPSSRRTVYEYKPASGADAKRRHPEIALKELTLLGIAGELLKKRRHEEPGDVEAVGFAQKLYFFWLRCLGAASGSLLKPEDRMSESAGSTYERDDTVPTGREKYISDMKRYTLSLSLFGHYLRRLSLAFGDVTLSDIFAQDEDPTPGGLFELFNLAARPWPGHEGISYAEIESLTSAPGAGEFARELLRQRALMHLRVFYTGTEYERKLSELEAVLTHRDTRS